MLDISVDTDSKTYTLYLKLKDTLELYQTTMATGEDLTLHFGDMVSLSYTKNNKIKPLYIDFTKDKMFYRLQHTSKNKEPLVRAVMTGLDDKALVIDATAGLGRDSMVLQRFGSRVLMFERNVVIYALLHDALDRARADESFMISMGTLPRLYNLGSIDGYAGDRPEVIYYDPMFPERKKSAMVKKDMQILKALIGADEDVEVFLKKSLTLARRRVVLKRPKTASLVSVDGIEPYSSTDGGNCRFDCYRAISSII
ncbi:class I SAM-dependent methyltransferase [Anaerobiospirillum thomasii]|uniref:Ribosomal RNA small subunit methyltransferase J n=1 Tax=Anaerobiospirillum thomasii TaxID=179995 RepID=A0A2X0V5U5_9GAMM|nr:class I SAM-dependent methyltransferase [Anaerobiospirillum thomasii]SPT69223.1 Ribosomal RNA small subunit methyltransferase J [Anaerobiospirillum thomasii]